MSCLHSFIFSFFLSVWNSLLLTSQLFCGHYLHSFTFSLFSSVWNSTLSYFMGVTGQLFGGSYLNNFAFSFFLSVWNSVLVIFRELLLSQPLPPPCITPSICTSPLSCLSWDGRQNLLLETELTHASCLCQNEPELCSSDGKRSS